MKIFKDIKVGNRLPLLSFMDTPILVDKPDAQGGRGPVCFLPTNRVLDYLHPNIRQLIVPLA